MSGKERDEMERVLDEFVEKFGGRIMEEDTKLQILNAGRTQQMAFAHEVIKSLLSGQDVSISYQINEPFKGSGSITIEGREISFGDTKWFVAASQFADNFEVYPLTDGKIRLAFSFYNLTVIV